MPRVRRRPRVALGVTGSIAAYKAALVVRELVKAGAEVRCALTPGGARFITPLSLAALSRSPVLQELHDPGLWDMAHLSLAQWADVLVIAPATADAIARLASGRAEGLLDALALSFRGPLAICPAMDAQMWDHPATRANVARLRDYGYQIWGPERGELASGKVAAGRLLDPADIARRALSAAAK